MEGNINTKGTFNGQHAVAHTILPSILHQFGICIILRRVLTERPYEGRAAPVSAAQTSVHMLSHPLIVGFLRSPRYLPLLCERGNEVMNQRRVTEVIKKHMH